MEIVVQTQDSLCHDSRGLTTFQSSFDSGEIDDYNTPESHTEFHEKLEHHVQHMIKVDFINNKHQSKAVKTLILKPLYSRSEQEKNELFLLIQKIPFFEKNNLKKYDIVELANILEFQQNVQQQNVINYGEKGDKFYLILRGVVSVEIPNPAIKNWQAKNAEYQRLLQFRNSEIEEKIQQVQKDSHFHYKERRLSRIKKRSELKKTQMSINESGGGESLCQDDYFVFDPIKHIHYLKLTPEEQLKWDRFVELDSVKWFITVAHLQTGNTFGELALINDAPRAATIKCMSNCYFATIEKSDYQKILQKMIMKQYQAKMDFLVSLPLFSSFSMRKLKMMMQTFQTKTYKINHVVYSQGAPADYVYIVYKGTFEIYRHCIKKQHFNHNVAEMIGPGGKILNKNFQIERPLKPMEIRIATCTEGQVLGFEDVLSNRNYTTTVKCLSSEGTLFIMKSEEFHHKMKKDQKKWQNLLDIGSSRDQNTIQQIKKATKDIKNHNTTISFDELPKEKVINKNKLRVTSERVIDFRATLQEIIDVKNGGKPRDFGEYRSKKTIEISMPKELRVERGPTSNSLSTFDFRSPAIFSPMSVSLLSPLSVSPTSQKYLDNRQLPKPKSYVIKRTKKQKIATTFFRDKNGHVQVPTNKYVQSPMLSQVTTPHGEIDISDMKNLFSTYQERPKTSEKYNKKRLINQFF